LKHFQDISDALEKGMLRACETMYRFCGKTEIPLNAEYLLTISLASAIEDINLQVTDPYEIRLEFSSKKFERDCQPLIGKNSDFGVVMRKLRSKSIKHCVKRSGRVDIAVYDHSAESILPIPLCPIEVKGFNPSRKLAIQDLERNLQFHETQGPTGNSILEFSFFSAIHSRSPTSFATNLADVLTLYKGWAAQLGTLQTVDAYIRVFTVTSDLNGRLLEERYETVWDGSSLHHFVGVIVAFVRKGFEQKIPVEFVRLI